MNPKLTRVSRGLGRFGSPVAILVVLLGLLTVGIAWNGSAGFTVTAAQMPYLISGLGIGLSFARRIAQAHNGDVQCQSRPGRGSTFSIVLPVVPKTKKKR